VATLGLTVCGMTLPAESGSAGIATPSARVLRSVGRPGAAERRAVTIRSLGAVGDRSLGLVLTATFKGDIERYLGRGQLRNWSLVLRLAPASGGRPRAGVLDEGGGSARALVPLLQRRGTDVTRIKPVALAVVTPDRVLRTAHARKIEVLRDGDRVIFHVPAADLRHVADITLEVFATKPIDSSSPTGPGWRKLLAAKPAERASLTFPASLTCKQLASIIKRRVDVSPVDLEPELKREEQAQAHLKAALRDFGAIRHVLDKTPGLREISRSDLEHDLGVTTARVVRLRREIAGVGGVSIAINARIRYCASQSTPTPPGSSTTATPPSGGAVSAAQTDARLNQEMAPQPGLAFSSAAPSGVPVIGVNDQVRYQKFSGLGAAMTDSSAWLIYENLATASRLTLMQDLFSSSGIHLNFLRVPMGASDYTVGASPYTYDDMPAGQSDPALTQFSIAHDVPYIIPTVKQALTINPGLQISANPWSPPGWMKANDSLANNNLQGILLPSAYQPLANYFVKFIQAYEADGVPIDIVVPQNEPASPGGPGTSYPGLTFPEGAEATFISQYLHPALTAAGLGPKIYGNDLSWDQLSYAAPLAASQGGDLSGLAWHCYAGSPTVMSQIRQADPALDQIVDECSPEIRSFGAPEYLISVLRNWASEAAVWNVALDPQGGPKQTHNGCPGCIGLATINEQTHAFSFNTEYYDLGQVSGFVQPGAMRIDSPNFVTYGTDSSNFETVTSGLDDVAFLNPDGSKVLIAYNNSTTPIAFAVESGGRYFSYTIPPQAMTTFRWS
jgi:glucosylceramidase